ncbi:methyltransferase [Rariglobus hedericola]|nr:methyltransferase domain-containing protein [Rariglobus hedericola]
MSESPAPFPPSPARPSLAFDRKAGSYDVHAHVQRDTAAWVAEWLPPAGTFATCLEFGAGTGNFTRHLESRFTQLEATDHAPAMVAQGRLAFPSVTWSERDAWNPADPAGTRDFVASCSVLQWAADPVGVLTRWRRLLRPGGRHLSGIYIAPSLPEFGALIPERRPFPWRTADEWSKSFSAAGFTDIRVDTKTREYIYPTARALMRQLHGTGATIVGAPLAAGRLVTLLRDYERVHRRADGVPATWTFCRIEAVA